MDKVKELLLSHGEKVVAVVVGLLGLMALASANWSPNSQSPTELIDITSRAKTQIQQNQWPDEEKQVFEDVKDVESMVRDKSKILTRAEDFQVQAFNPTIIRVQAKRTAVEVVPPESPIATPLVVAIALKPEEDQGEMDESTEGDGDKTDSEEKEKSADEMSEEEQIAALIARKFSKRKDTAGPAGGLAGYPGEGGGAEPGTLGEGGPGGASMLDSFAGEASQYGEAGGYGEGSDLYGTYGAGLMVEETPVRVAAGVSVRMVIDLQKQRQLLRKALHLSSDYREAQALIQYVDLVVERRRKQGPGVWDEWEQVKSEDLAEILKVSLGIDQDIVSPAVTRSTITMPLPRRAIGTWQPEEASHPRVENFELTEEERRLIDKWNQRINERLAKEKEEVEQQEEVKPRGFSPFVQTATDTASSMMAGSAMGGYGASMAAMMGGAGGEGEEGGEYESAYDYDDFAQSMGEGSRLTAEQKQLLDATKATADHRLLLVRFMDFTVDRGFAYQYRVRLEMKNPNYKVPIDKLADPGLGAAQTLFSDWSAPTPEAFVPLPHRIYLTDVDARRGDAEKASFAVYTDTTDVGTPVMADLRSVLVGLPIAGTEKVEAVDLTTRDVGPREIAIRTNEILAAATEVERISVSSHPDKMRPVIDAYRGRPMPHFVTVIDAEGNLVLRAVGENARQERMDRLLAKKLLEEFEDWKKKKTASSFFGGEGEGEGEGGGYGGMGMSYASSAGGSFYGNGGEGGEGGEGGRPSGRNRSSRRNRR